jgi:hypothetical protein
MHREFGSQGLVVITVTTDEPEDTPEVLDFLRKSGATTTNYLLTYTDEDEKKWGEQYPTAPQPMMWVYNRKGARVIQDEGEMKPEQLDELVKKLLAEN